MSIQQNLLFLVISLGATGLGVFARSSLIRIMGRKARADQVVGIGAIGRSFRSAITNEGPRDLGHGRTELRPSRNQRLVLPVCVLCILATLNIVPLLESFGIHNALVHRGLFFGLCTLFWAGWFSVLCVHRITWDRKTLCYYGITMRRHMRGLGDLIDIRKRPGRLAIELTFRGQPSLTLPSYLSHRDTFLAVLQEIENRNTNNGMVPSFFGARAQGAA